jgi:NitT/TauT family transport system substrate-binding protein
METAVKIASPWHGVASAGLALALWAGVLQGAEAQAKLTIMVGGVEKILYLPAKLAEQLGYYKAEGLDVELVSVTAGSVSDTGLLSGSADAAVGAYEQTLHLQAAGKFVTSIVQFSQTPQETLLVASSQAGKIKTVADLKGATIGVTGFGTLTHYLSQDLLVRSGLRQGDAGFLSVGAGNTFIGSMQRNRIDAGMTSEPTVSIMLDSKDAKVLVDMRTPEQTRAALGGDYPGSAVYVRADWLQKNPATAQKLANALTHALQFIATHSAEQIADKMPPSYYNGNRRVYVEALAHSIASFTADGKMPADGPKTVLDVLSRFGAGIVPAKIDLSKSFTNQFVNAVPANKVAAK